jgi:hypothetical protein
MTVERTTIDGVRHYTDGDDSTMSVTTVLKDLETDDTGLQTWQRRNDGEDGNPHHPHLFWYSGPRGTLCHYDVLSEFEDRYPKDEPMWGTEEASAIGVLTSGGPSEGTVDAFGEHDASYDEDDIVYSLLKDRDMVEGRAQYERFFADTGLDDIIEMDREWFEDAFDDVASDLGINGDTVELVEAYVFEPELYVAGQADLVYEAQDGAMVLADLKTSSSVRQKHRLQTVAYATALTRSDDYPSIDRIEVIRCSPTKESVEVLADTEPNYETPSYYDTEDWYEDPWGDFSYEDRAEMWEHFTDIAERVHDDPTLVKDDG